MDLSSVPEALWLVARDPLYVRQRLEKGQASVGYRFSVVGGFTERSRPGRTLVGRPMRPEPRPNHGHRDPHEDEAERFESEIEKSPSWDQA